MKIFKIVLTMTVLCSLFLCANYEASAYPLQQYSVNTDFYSDRMGSGGPFYVQPLTYGSSSPTFCLEIQEFISGGTFTYWGTNDSYADTGGHDLDGTPDGKDYLNSTTKNLFNYFLDNPSLDANHKAAMQLAIWRLEGEVNSSYSAEWGGHTGFSDAQIIALKGIADDYVTHAGSLTATNREIMVLNLYGVKNSETYAPTERYQSLLIPVPTPEPGTLLFLGAGLIGVVLIRRKNGKSVK